MAMTKCKECGAEISTTADACPRCGAKQVRTSGCAKLALGVIVFFVLVSVLGQCSRSDAPAPQSASVSQAASAPVPHDDLTHFIARFGEPDRVESSENETPRPPIVTKFLVYETERVRAVYVVDAPINSPPPYNKWKLFGFQDPQTNEVLQPAEAIDRLKARDRQL